MRGEQLRPDPQLQSPARSSHLAVVGPLVLALLVQAAAIVAAVALGLPWAAIIGLVLAIAIITAGVSRRAVGNLVAGAGIRVAQPYGPGEQIRVFVPALDSVEDAEIVRVGAANTTLQTSRGLVSVPNADMLRGGART